MVRSRFCFNYAGLLLAVSASLATSLLFALDDDVLTWAEALRSFLQVGIASIAYAQTPHSRRWLLSQLRAASLHRRDGDEPRPPQA